MLIQRKFNQILFTTFLMILSCTILLGQNTELIKFEKSIEQGNYNEIERSVLNYAIKNPKDAKAFELLGKIRFRQNRINEAKSLFKRALVLDSSLISAKISLVETHYESEELESAQILLNEISNNKIVKESHLLQLAKLYSKIDNCEKALQVSDKLSLRLKNTKALTLRAKCFIEKQQTNKINGLVKIANNLRKTDVIIATEFADLLQKVSMLKDAENVIKSILLKSPTNEKAIALLAKNHIYSKKFPAAKRSISKLKRTNPKSIELLFVQGLFEFEQGNAKVSYEKFEEYLKLKPNDIEGLRFYAISAMRNKQAKTALKTADILLQLKPNEAEFLYLRGAASLQTGNLVKAESSLESFMKKKPNDSQGCLALGLTYAAQEDKFDIARNQMKKCIAINPNNYEAKYQIGLSYRKEGETKMAISYLEQVIADKSDYAAALRDLGGLYAQDGQEQKARNVLEKAVAINSSDADTHFQLSRVYNLLGEQLLAKKHLNIFQNLRKQKTGGM